MLKKFILSKLLKFKIVESKKGKIILFIEAMEKISEEYFIYQNFLKEALIIKNGIKDVYVNFERREVKIIYNENILSEKEVLNWIDKVKEVGIDNYERIKREWEYNREGLINDIRRELESYK